MSNPVLEALTHHRVAEIVEPPRSWTAEFKKVFLELPRHLQFYLAARDKERDRAVRIAQNEKAEAVKKLAATLDRLERAEAKLKELENVQTHG